MRENGSLYFHIIDFRSKHLVMVQTCDPNKQTNKQTNAKQTKLKQHSLLHLQHLKSVYSMYDKTQFSK
jgi:hypothetical protein